MDDVTLKLNATYDGEVVVGTVAVPVHNAICQSRDHNRRKLPTVAVEAAQTAVDAAYQADSANTVE